MLKKRELRNILYEYIYKIKTMDKIFKDIVGYEGRYKIASDGTIISTVHSKPKVLKHILVRTRYLMVGLRKSSKDKPVLMSVPNLVLSIWGPPKPSDKHKVNFKDGNPKNVDIKNLEWISKEDLMRKTVNRIKSTVKHRDRYPVIVLGYGYVDIGKKLNISTRRHIDTQMYTKNGYMVFTPRGFEKYIEKYGGRVVY